jgi:PAS domain S-box-containing protein
VENGSERFAHLTRFTNDIVLFTDTEGRIVSCNERALAAYGFTGVELAGRAAAELSPPGLVAAGRRQLNLAKARGGLVYETCHRRKDGSEFPVEISVRPFETGGERFIQHVVRDITARKRVEEALRRSESWLRDMAELQRSNQIYRMLSATNRAIARARTLEELLGEACSIAVSQPGLSLAAVTRPDPGPGMAGPKVIASGGLQSRDLVEELLALELREASAGKDAGADIGILVVNDVEHGPVTGGARLACLRRGVRSYASFPLGNAGCPDARFTLFSSEAGFFDRDTLDQLADVARDLSLAVSRFTERAARQRAEIRLREATHRMSALVDAAPVAIFDLDPEGRVLGVWNPAAERMFGWRRHEVLGRRLPVLAIDEEDEAQFDAAHRTVLLGGSVAGLEACRRRRDESLVQLSLSMAPVAANDGTPAVLVVAEDIATRHESIELVRRSRDELEERILERTLELASARDRAEEADRIKSAFLGNISQELRTPLNSIIGFSSLLLSGAPGAINEEQGKQLAIVRDAGERLLALVENVLDMSRLQATNVRLPCEPTPLRDMALRVADTMRAQAIGRGLTLETDVEHCVALAEPRRLEQVIMNLVSNAVKFTTVGGVTVRCRRKNRIIEIAVADTGPGIRPEEQHGLFAPFSPVKPGRSERDGNGLGLAISRRLVEAMGGGIWVESEPGRGSVFTVRLEAAEPTAAHA